MNRPPTKEELEEISHLIQACNLLGATFQTDLIVLADKTELVLEDAGYTWKLWQDKVRNRDVLHIPKGLRPQKVQIAVLELHIKILKQNS